MKNKTIIILLTALCFFAFFIFGITDNLKGPTLPSMLAELNINYGTGGNIFFSEYVGFFIATLITGILADRYGLKIVMVLAGILLALGVGGYSSFGTPLLLSISLFIVGLGLGAFELGPNAVIVSLYRDHKGLYLNLMSVMHGMGSMLAPLFVGLMLNAGTSWREIYRWDLILIAALILFSIFLRFPGSSEKSSLDFKAIPKVAFKQKMPLYYFAMLFYVAAEIGLASWMVVYLQERRGLDQVSSNNFLALFFGLLMVGRFLGSFIVRRLGYIRAILISSLLSTICISIGIFTEASLFIPLTGFFFSIIFPTLTAAVSDEVHENTNTILGVLFTFSGFGGIIGPWLVAWSSEIFGLQVGLSLITALTAITFLFIIMIDRRRMDGQSS